MSQCLTYYEDSHPLYDISSCICICNTTYILIAGHSLTTEYFYTVVLLHLLLLFLPPLLTNISLLLELLQDKALVIHLSYCHEPVST